MPNEILQNYPLAPIVRREFLKKASAAALLWSATPRTAFAQAAGPESLLIRGGLIVTAERQFFADIRARGGKIAQIGAMIRPDRVAFVWPSLVRLVRPALPPLRDDPV